MLISMSFMVKGSDTYSEALIFYQDKEYQKIK
ncbi:hypothetical protein TSL6_09430 [Sulfurovum sp. TSL6]|nr:hypothetical protein TSL6_09430 [Sulfurovum sp. TSL6]